MCPGLRQLKQTKSACRERTPRRLSAGLPLRPAGLQSAGLSGRRPVLLLLRSPDSTQPTKSGGTDGFRHVRWVLPHGSAAEVVRQVFDKEYGSRVLVKLGYHESAVRKFRSIVFQALRLTQSEQIKASLFLLIHGAKGFTKRLLQCLPVTKLFTSVQGRHEP